MTEIKAFLLEIGLNELPATMIGSNEHESQVLSGSK